MQSRCATRICVPADPKIAHCSRNSHTVARDVEADRVCIDRLVSCYTVPSGLEVGLGFTDRHPNRGLGVDLVLIDRRLNRDLGVDLAYTRGRTWRDLLLQGKDLARRNRTTVVIRRAEERGSHC